MNRVRLTLATLSILSLLATAGPAVAGSARSATVGLNFAIAADGRCYATASATWTGYQVNRVRFIYYLEGKSINDWAWVDTASYPANESHTSGTLTSTAGVAAAPGQGWFVYALFRSNGGARLAEAVSAEAFAPTGCLYP